MPIITLSVYNLGNPSLSSRINKFDKTNPTPTPTPSVTPTPTPTLSLTPPPEIDIVIVGGGITGTYMARRLSSQFPLLKILLIEKTDRIGGRLFSSYLGTDGNPLDTALEYGGMRFFPSIQPRITKLVEMLDLSKVEVPYSAPNNLFSGRTRTFLNKDLFPNTKDVYFLEPQEDDAVVFDTINDNIYAKFVEYGVNPNPLYESRISAFQNLELSKLAYRTEVMKGPTTISTENYRRYSNITGYDSMFYGNSNFIILAYEHTSLNTFDSAQYFVKEGYEQVPIQCINPFSSISFNDVKKQNFTTNKLLLMNTELLKFDATDDNKVQITVTDGNENATFKVKKLFITAPTNTLQSIQGFPSEYFNKITTVTKQLPLFKIFLYYDTNWWQNLGFSIGRSTTDMPIDQVWFYNDNTLMVYAVVENAEFWSAQLPSSEQIELIGVNSPYPSFLSYLMTFVKKVFKDYIDDVPFPNKIGWKYWENGGAFWNALDNTSPNKSIYDTEVDLINVLGKNGNVNYINNDISLNQGWTEGSLEIVDQFLKDKFNMPEILEIDKL